MTQNKRGFTLIELLAVIVILALIALIAVPVIMNIISSARESAFKDTMYGVVKAGELYYAEQLLTADGMTEDVTFIFSEDGVSPSGLNIKGSLPTSGTMTIIKDGKIILNATDGTYTATKTADSAEIIIVKQQVEEEIPTPEPEVPAVKTLKDLAKTNDFATTVNACATSGTCAVGTKFAIEVAPNNIQNFYVINDENDIITLIMDSNIADCVSWIDAWDYGCGEEGDNCAKTDKGPITALNYLESETSEWTNIETKNYTLTDSSYGPITRTNVRARMITNDEAEKILNYSWSYDNLNGLGSGYWTSSSDMTIRAFYVRESGDIGSYYVYYPGHVSDGGDFGVRPVIEISK